MSTYFSPDGNPEVWDEKPDGYFLPEEWAELHPAPEPEPPSIDEAKAAKKDAIDANTNRIRDRDGMAYGGERFAMNDGAMLKWTGLMAARDMIPYPMTILTIDDKPFQFASQVELMTFMGAVLGYETAADSPLSTGRALRQRIEAATSIEELNSIVDARE